MGRIDLPPQITAAPDPLDTRAALEKRALTVAPVSSYTYLGCFHDTDTDRVLTQFSDENVARNNPSYCCDYCSHLNTEYVYCGVENGNNCYCDSATADDASSLPSSRCQSTCDGRENARCGDFFAINLYSLTETKPSRTGGDITTASVSGYTHLGCFTDHEERVLGGPQITPLALDPAFCCEWCGHQEGGFQMCGVEFGNQCYCGTTTTRGALTAAPEDCNDRCAGAERLACGASFRINIYSYTGTGSSTTTRTATTGGPSSSSTSLPGSSNGDSSGLSGGAIAGIVIGVLAALAALAALFFFRRKIASSIGNKGSHDPSELDGLSGDGGAGSTGVPSEANKSPNSQYQQQYGYYQGSPHHPPPTELDTNHEHPSEMQG